MTYNINNIIDLLNISNPSSQTLKAFVSSYQENSQALLALKHNIQKDNTVLSTLLLRELDCDTHKNFEDSRMDVQNIPDVREITRFLENESSRLEAANINQNTSQK